MNYIRGRAASILIGGIIVLSAIAAGNFLHSSNLMAQTSGITIVALGDSLTSGTGATSGNDWVSLIDRWSGIDIINEGVSGDTTEEALDRLKDDVLARNPDIVVIFLGGNDALQNVDLDDTIENLGEIIDAIIDDGATPILVGAHGTVFSRSREEAFDDLAEEKDIRYVESVLDEILGNPDRLDDPVHPNDTGYRLVARRIWDELREVINDEFPGRDLHAYCEATRTEGRIGNEVRFEAYVWGGEDASSYDLDWDLDDGGDDGPFGDGSGEEETTRYETGGTKNARLTATAGEEEETVACRAITIRAPELVGSCEVSVRATTRDGEGDAEDERVAEVTWTARAAGADGTHQFQWGNLTGSPTVDDPDDDDDSDITTNRITRIYTGAGQKVAEVTITASSTSPIRLTCSTTLSPALFDEESSSGEMLRGSCEIDPGSFSIEDEVRWESDIEGIPGEGDEEDATVTWSGSDGLSGSSTEVSIQYDEPGTKTGTVRIESGGQTVESSCQIRIAEEAVDGGDNGDGDGDGCFIATAAYGSEFEPHVATLREFRDQVLLPTPLGWLFVHAYYAVSPPIADFIREHETIKPAIRTALVPAVWYADWKLR